MRVQTLIDEPKPRMSIPSKLTNKMKIAAALIGSGYSVPEVVAATGLNKANLYIVCKSELFRSEVARVQKKFEDSVINDVKKRLAAEAPASLNTLIAIRDNDDPKGLGESRKAASYLLDKVIGKDSKGENGNEASHGNVTIIIGGEDGERLKSVAGEIEPDFKRIT